MLRRGVERESARIPHLLMNLLHRLAVDVDLAGSSGRQEFSACVFRGNSFNRPIIFAGVKGRKMIMRVPKNFVDLVGYLCLGTVPEIFDRQPKSYVLVAVLLS